MASIPDAQTRADISSKENYRLTPFVNLDAMILKKIARKSNTKYIKITIHYSCTWCTQHSSQKCKEEKSHMTTAVGAENRVIQTAHSGTHVYLI